MSHKSLEDLLRETGNPVKLLRNSQIGPAGALPLGIASLHFYSFGGFRKTIDSINAAQ